MKVMLLAAGHGVRMHPLTASMPKPAIPVLGRPIIIQVLQRLASYGLRSATLNLHHLGHLIESLLAGGWLTGIDELMFSYEQEILGTAGGIRAARAFLSGSGTILVRNSDFLEDIDLEAAVRAHRLSGCPATLVLAPVRTGYTRVAVDHGGRVISLGDNPAGSYMFTGMHFIEEEIIDLIPPTGPSDIVHDVYRLLADAGKLGSYVHHGFWWEFGDPESYLEGCMQLLGLPVNRRREVADTDPVRTIDGCRVAIGPGAEYHPNVSFRTGAAIGMASMVAEGSMVEETVIMPEAWIGPGCRLERCIICPGVELPEGTTLKDVMVSIGDDRDAGLQIRRIGQP